MLFGGHRWSSGLARYNIWKDRSKRPRARIRGSNPTATISYLDFFLGWTRKSILNALGSVGRDKSGKMEMTRCDVNGKKRVHLHCIVICWWRNVVNEIKEHLFEVPTLKKCYLRKAVDQATKTCGSHKVKVAHPGAPFTKACRTSSLRYLTYGLPKWALNLRFSTNSQANHKVGHLSFEKPVNPSSFYKF